MSHTPWIYTNPTLRPVYTKLGFVVVEKLPSYKPEGTEVVCRPYDVFREGVKLGQIVRIGAGGKWAIDKRYGAWKTRREAIEELQQRPQQQ